MFFNSVFILLMKVSMESGFEWPAAYCNVFIADAFTLQSIAHKVHSVLSCRLVVIDCILLSCTESPFDCNDFSGHFRAYEVRLILFNQCTVSQSSSAFS